jgi:carbon monoxide dehydrogenase subunit G
LKLENQCVVPAGWDQTWELLMDIPGAAALVPGVEEVTPEDEGRYQARMQVRVGPMRLNFSGLIQLQEQDRAKGEAKFRVEAADRQLGGSLRADLVMQLEQQSQEQTGVSIATDVAFMGKLGELGQPLIRRKAASTLQDFARNLSKQVASPGV